MAKTFQISVSERSFHFRREFVILTLVTVYLWWFYYISGSPWLQIAYPDIFSSLIEFFYPFAFGLLAGVLLYWTGSTWAAVAVHGGIHIFDTITDNFGMLNGSYRTLLTSFLMILVSVIIILKNPEKFRWLGLDRQPIWSFHYPRKVIKELVAFWVEREGKFSK